MYEDATPNKIAMGFAVGLFTSFYPAPVVDTVVAPALAYRSLTTVIPPFPTMKISGH